MLHFFLMTSQCDEKDWGIYASDEGRGASCYFAVNGFRTHWVGSSGKGDVSHLIQVSFKFVQNILFLESLDEVPANTQISHPVLWPISNKVSRSLIGIKYIIITGDVQLTQITCSHSVSSNLSSWNINHWPTFLKTILLAPLTPMIKMGNLRFASGSNRGAENKHLNVLPAKQLPVSRTFCTRLTLSMFLWLQKHNTGCVTGKGTPYSHTVFSYNMGPLTTQTCSWFNRSTITSNLRVFLAIIRQLRKSVSGHSHLQKALFFP